MSNERNWLSRNALLVALGLGLLMHGVAWGQLRNPSFEDAGKDGGARYWTTRNAKYDAIVRDCRVSTHGSCSIRMERGTKETRTARAAIDTQTMVIQPGCYKVSVDILEKFRGLNKRRNRLTEASLQMWNVDNGRKTTLDLGRTTTTRGAKCGTNDRKAIHKCIDKNPSKGGWETFTGYMNIKKPTKCKTVLYAHRNSDMKGTAWMDNVQVKKISCGEIP